MAGWMCYSKTMTVNWYQDKNFYSNAKQQSPVYLCVYLFNFFALWSLNKWQNLLSCSFVSELPFVSCTEKITRNKTAAQSVINTDL